MMRNIIPFEDYGSERSGDKQNVIDACLSCKRKTCYYDIQEHCPILKRLNKEEEDETNGI